MKSPRNPVERALVYPVIGTALGCWSGAFPIALDWDRPWQVGPATPFVRPLPTKMSTGMAIDYRTWCHNGVHTRLCPCSGSQRCRFSDHTAAKSSNGQIKDSLIHTYHGAPSAQSIEMFDFKASEDHRSIV